MGRWQRVTRNEKRENGQQDIVRMKENGSETTENGIQKRIQKNSDRIMKEGRLKENGN